MSHSSLPITSKLFQLTFLTCALALAGCGGGSGDTVDSIAPKPDTGNNGGSNNSATQASGIYISESPRDCRRPNFLREYDNENTTLHS